MRSVYHFPLDPQKNPTWDIKFKPAIAICAGSANYWQCWLLDPSLKCPRTWPEPMSIPQCLDRGVGIFASQRACQNFRSCLCASCPMVNPSWGPWLCSTAIHKETVGPHFWQSRCLPTLNPRIHAALCPISEFAEHFFSLNIFFTMKFLYIFITVLPLALAIATPQNTACRCAPKPCPVTQPEVHANQVMAFWLITFVNHRINSYPKRWPDSAV